jgi:ketosteroid isomerase-like protein
MTDRQAIENLLEELYAARVRGDLETITRLFAANATFQVAGTDDASPMPTLVKGNAGITRAHSGFSDS